MASPNRSPEPPAENSPRPSRRSAFLARTASTGALWLLVAAALIFSKEILYYLLIVGFAVLGLAEYFRILQFRHAKWESIVTMAVSAIYLSLCFWQAAGGGGTDFQIYTGIALAVIVFAGFAVNLVFPIQPGLSHVTIMACVFGFVYIAFLFNFLTAILFLDDGSGSASDVPGRFYVLFLLAVTKFTDMGAYVIGSIIGKHKMIPRVSPGKTWEGIAGAVAVAFLGSFGIYWLFGDHIPLITPLHAAVLAVLLAAAAVLGDLAESILKRSVSAKDSGHVMPGIGGVLDLIDSVLFTAPLFYFYLLWLTP